MDDFPAFMKIVSERQQNALIYGMPVSNQELKMIADEIKLPKEDEKPKFVDCRDEQLALHVKVDVLPSALEPRMLASHLDEIHKVIVESMGGEDYRQWSGTRTFRDFVEANRVRNCRCDVNSVYGDLDTHSSNECSSNIEIGMAVELITASAIECPVMTVTEIMCNDGGVHSGDFRRVIWFDNDRHLQSAIFPASLLRRYQE